MSAIIGQAAASFDGYFDGVRNLPCSAAKAKAGS
jgi:hypothetical protein